MSEKNVRNMVLGIGVVLCLVSSGAVYAYNSDNANANLAPDGTYVGGQPHLAPNGAYVGGNPLSVIDPEGLAGKGNGGDGSASGSGTNQPYKHCRELSPPDPRFIECKRKSDGKKIRVPRPESWPYPGGKEKTFCEGVLDLVHDLFWKPKSEPDPLDYDSGSPNSKANPSNPILPVPGWTRFMLP